MFYRMLKIGAGVLILAVGLAGILYIRVNQHFQEHRSKGYRPSEIGISAMIKNADIELGRRIVTIRNGCVECHGADLGGKLFLDDPGMGKFYGANITPYRLKKFSDEEIAQAIRHGLNREKKSLLFMPSFEYMPLGKEDLAATIAYIRSVPAVQNDVPQSETGPMAKILFMFDQMPVLLPAERIVMSDDFAKKPRETASKEFGKYLVATACVGCHGADLKGGPIPGGPPDWPEAANLRLGADTTWNEERFKTTILTGVSARTGLPLRPPMPVVLLQQMNATEIAAIWTYLHELK